MKEAASAISPPGGWAEFFQRLWGIWSFLGEGEGDDACGELWVPNATDGSNALKEGRLQLSTESGMQEGKEPQEERSAHPIAPLACGSVGQKKIDWGLKTLSDGTVRLEVSFIRMGWGSG